MRKVLGCIALGLVIIGCIAGCTASFAYRNDFVQTYSATDPLKVQIFSERHIKQPVIELGYVTVHNTADAKGDFLKDVIKQKAASLGADAVVGFQIFAFTAEGIAVKYQ